MTRPMIGSTIRFNTYQPVPRDEPDADPKKVAMTGIVVGYDEDNDDLLRVLLLNGLSFDGNKTLGRDQVLTLNIDSSDVTETISTAQLYDGSAYDGGFIDTHSAANYMGSGKLTNMVLTAGDYVLAFQSGFVRGGTFSFSQIANSIADLSIGGEVLPYLLDDDHPDNFVQHLPVEPSEENEDACDNDWVYNDGEVYIEFTARVDGQATIHDITTLNATKRGARTGVGRATLQTLKSHFPLIIASGVGEDPNENLLEFKPFLFWKSMLEEKLVDGIVLIYDSVMITRDNLQEKLVEIEAEHGPVVPRL